MVRSGAPVLHYQKRLPALPQPLRPRLKAGREVDRKSTRLNSSHSQISYAVFCLKKKKHTSTIPNSSAGANTLFSQAPHILDQTCSFLPISNETVRPNIVDCVHILLIDRS